MRTRRLLVLTLLPPVALAYGCRSAPIEFDLWDGLIDGVVDSAFDAIDGDESPDEKIDRHRQEVRQQL